MNNTEKEEYIDNVKEWWFKVCIFVVVLGFIIGGLAGLFFLISWLSNFPCFNTISKIIALFFILSPFIIFVIYLFYSSFKAIKYSRELKKSYHIKKE